MRECRPQRFEKVPTGSRLPVGGNDPDVLDVLLQPARYPEFETDRMRLLRPIRENIAHFWRLIALGLALCLIAADGHPGETAPPPAPDLWVYCSGHCTYCRKAERHLASDTLFDSHFIQVREKPKPPEIVEPEWITKAIESNPQRIAAGLQPFGYPFFVFRNGKGKLVFICGFRDVADLARRYRGNL